MANVDLAVLNDHELDLNTSMMYRHEDYLEAIRLVNEGKVRLEPLMSRHFPFRDYLAAYRYIDANRETTMKVLIDVDESEGVNVEKIAETINGLQHIGLPTNDLEKTVAFYEGLGFSVALRTVNEAAGNR